MILSPGSRVSVFAYCCEVLENYGSVLADAVKYFPSLVRSPQRRVFLKQVLFTGVESLPLMCFAALLTGVFSTGQLYTVLGRDLERTIEVFRVLLVQKAAVILVSIYTLARSGSAIATELANAKQHGEVSSLYRMGIDPGRYLVAPRVAGAALSVATLTVCFQFILVFGGFAGAGLLVGWDFLVALTIYTRGIHVPAAIATFAMSLAIGTAIAVVACQNGLRAAAGAQGVPGAARATVVHGFVAILVIFFLTTVLFP